MMDVAYIDHGDLFWIDLNPFFDEYVLAKVIDHSYFRETDPMGSPYYIYVYNYFSDAPSEDIPDVNDRSLYCHPFNCKMYFFSGLFRILPIKSEYVDEREVIDQVVINSRGAKIYDPSDILFTDINMSTLDIEFPLSDLKNLELHDFYVDKGIQSRVIIEVCKNRGIDIYKLLDHKGPESEYLSFILDYLKPILDFPSYLKIPIEERGTFDFDWSTMLNSKMIDNKNDIERFNYDEDPKYCYNERTRFSFYKVDPIYKEFGLRGTGRIQMALLFSIMELHKELIGDFELEIVIPENAGNSFFELRFMTKEENEAVRKFYNQEMLNPKRLRKLLPLMVYEYVELFDARKKLNEPHHTDYIRFEHEDSKCDYLGLYYYLTDNGTTYGLTINSDGLLEPYEATLLQFCDLPNGEFWKEVIELIMTKKFKMDASTYEIDEEAGSCTLLTSNMQRRDQLYRLLKKHLKDHELLTELLSKYRV